jgi:hypothetical protein
MVSPVVEWAAATLDGRKAALQRILAIMPVVIETDAAEVFNDAVLRDSLADH